MEAHLFMISLFHIKSVFQEFLEKNKRCFMQTFEKLSQDRCL